MQYELQLIPHFKPAIGIVVGCEVCGVLLIGDVQPWVGFQWTLCRSSREALFVDLVWGCEVTRYKCGGGGVFRQLKRGNLEQ